MNDEQATRDAGQHGPLSRRDFLRGSAALGSALAFPGVLGALGGPDAALAAAKSGGTPKRGGRLSVAIHDGSTTDTLSPWAIPEYSGAARAQQVYERLFSLGPVGKPIPWLALSADAANTKATVWNVKLRPGVHFNNGKTVTAQDVLYSYKYVANPKNKAESLPRIQAVDLANSRAMSPTEIEFRLHRPIGDFEALLAEKALWIVPSGTTDFSKQVGTGPFTFVSWEPGVRALFKRNSNYWGIHAGGGPWVDELEIQMIPDNTARLNALLGNQVQEITFLDPVTAKAQQHNSAIQIIRSAQANTSPIYMEIDASLFRDNRVREAMKLVLDREAIVKNVLLGYGTVGNDLFGKGQPSYNSHLPQRVHDPEKAKALLKQAGVTHLTLTLPATDLAPGMLESALAFKQLGAPIGINVTIQKIPSGSYFTNNLYLKVPFYETQWAQGFVSQAQDGLLSNAPYNETHWYNKKWDAAFNAAQGIVDETKRLAAYKALQVPLWEQGGYIIPAVYETLDAAAAHVRGIVPSISDGFQDLGGFNFKDHWLA
jgi:peptide/nickel transport system substrate-binding protein